MKNNKKALSSPSGLFYIQDEWYVASAWMHRSDDIFKFELFFVLYFLFLWSAL